jgi:hypothetical protein
MTRSGYTSIVGLLWKTHLATVSCLTTRNLTACIPDLNNSGRHAAPRSACPWPTPSPSSSSTPPSPPSRRAWFIDTRDVVPRQRVRRGGCWRTCRRLFCPRRMTASTCRGLLQKHHLSCTNMLTPSMTLHANNNEAPGQRVGRPESPVGRPPNRCLAGPQGG